MKRLCHSIAIAILSFVLPLGAQATEFLIPGGQVIGVQLQNGSVIVAAFDDALGTAARDAGLQIGDEILLMDGQAVSSADDVRNALTLADPSITLTIRRKGQQHQLELLPCQTEAGPRLGIHLKQGITGIGTVTWYDPETAGFGALGHGIHSSDGSLLPMTKGTAYRAQVTSVKKGKSGEPGLLKGSADAQDACAALLRNTPQGIFGITRQHQQGDALPVAEFTEVQPGSATIRSTVSGNTVQEYSVEILKIYPEGRQDGRNFLLKITDPDLLATTGGIVQGMSGSPICQNGKIVGAVTHVLVNDPTKGYGIFIENMLEAAG